MKAEKMKYALLIPAYNEEENIKGVIQKSQKFVKDIFVVDDGSQDMTSLISRKAGAYVIRHEKNRGKGAAIITGFSEILKRNFDAVITIDADGQHLPSEIPVLITAFEHADGDIIIGERLINLDKMPFHRYLANKIGKFFISRAAGTHLRDTQSGFRIYSKEVIKRVIIDTRGFEMETEILLKARKAGFRIGSTRVTTVYADNHPSHFRPVKDFYKISILVLKNLFKKNERGGKR
jgi:glycosyltransferase involved in cell wall biosynthesis